MTSLDIIRLNRSEGIGSSDAKKIVEGDWHDLYLLKTGQVEDEDLSRVFRVQLGIFTEQFHIDWIAERDGHTIVEQQNRLYHPDHEFMFCHLDAFNETLGCPLEVKHSNSYANAADKAEYYMPQLQHTIAITSADRIQFSVIAGNDEPETIIVDRNQQYIDDLIELEKAFWWHVNEGVAPDITPTAKQMALAEQGKKTAINGLRPYDFEGNNQWAALAVDYTENAEAAKLFDNSKKELKKLIPDDARSVTGHGITAKRDKRGAIRFYT